MKFSLHSFNDSNYLCLGLVPGIPSNYALFYKVYIRGYNMNTRNLVYTALMTAIICVLGLVPGIPSNYASTYRITKYWYIFSGYYIR